MSDNAPAANRPVILQTSAGSRRIDNNVKYVILVDNSGNPLATGADGSLVISEGVAPTQVMSTALEAGKVLKGSPGSLKSLAINNTSGATQYYLLINSATLPVDGAVQLLYPPIPVAAGTFLALDLPDPIVASAGIVICNGPNNNFTKAIGGADSIYFAQVI
jgi:hypothetical protein